MILRLIDARRDRFFSFYIFTWFLPDLDHYEDLLMIIYRSYFEDMSVSSLVYYTETIFVSFPVFIYSRGSFQTWINVWEPFRRFVDDNISYFEDMSVSFLVYYAEIIFISFPVFIYSRGSFQTWINVWEMFRRFVDNNICRYERLLSRLLRDNCGINDSGLVY